MITKFGFMVASTCKSNKNQTVLNREISGIKSYTKDDLKLAVEFTVISKASSVKSRGNTKNEFVNQKTECI